MFVVIKIKGKLIEELLNTNGQISLPQLCGFHGKLLPNWLWKIFQFKEGLHEILYILNRVTIVHCFGIQSAIIKTQSDFFVFFFTRHERYVTGCSNIVSILFTVFRLVAMFDIFGCVIEMYSLIKLW